MTVTVTAAEPIRAVHGITYSDAAGVKRCHTTLYADLTAAEAAMNSQIVAKPPGTFSEVEFFTINF